MGQTVSRLLGSRREDVEVADGSVESHFTVVDRTVFRRRLKLEFTILYPRDEEEEEEEVERQEAASEAFASRAVIEAVSTPPPCEEEQQQGGQQQQQGEAAAEEEEYVMRAWRVVARIGLEGSDDDAE
jgi:hypothetical protein